MRWLDVRRGLGVRGGRLFCTLSGGPVSDAYVRALMPRLAGKAGVTKGCHAHGLRHSYAVQLEQAGLTVTQISKLLGHSSIAVTARYLDHLTNADAVTALQGIEFPSLYES
jgi:site-specific recombinase XerD